MGRAYCQPISDRVIMTTALPAALPRTARCALHKIQSPPQVDDRKKTAEHFAHRVCPFPTQPSTPFYDLDAIVRALPTFRCSWPIDSLSLPTTIGWVDCAKGRSQLPGGPRNAIQELLSQLPTLSSATTHKSSSSPLSWLTNSPGMGQTSFHTCESTSRQHTNARLPVSLS